MLCGIKFKRDAQRILSLLCYALRPLSIEEVIEALAVDIDDLECYNPRRRSAGGANHLVRICPRLIEINLGTVCTQEVWIAHFSVQEYLLSDRFRSSEAANFALLGPLQHGRISKACLLYLKHDDFLQQILRTWLDGPDTKWKPNLGVVKAVIRYTAATGRLNTGQRDPAEEDGNRM